MWVFFLCVRGVCVFEFVCVCMYDVCAPVCMCVYSCVYVCVCSFDVSFVYVYGVCVRALGCVLGVCACLCFDVWVLLCVCLYWVSVIQSIR